MYLYTLQGSHADQSAETDMHAEYARQRQHLEHSVAALRKKLSKDTEIHRMDNIRVMQVRTSVHVYTLLYEQVVVSASLYMHVRIRALIDIRTLFSRAFQLMQSYIILWRCMSHKTVTPCPSKLHRSSYTCVQTAMQGVIAPSLNTSVLSMTAVSVWYVVFGSGKRHTAERGE